MGVVRHRRCHRTGGFIPEWNILLKWGSREGDIGSDFTKGVSVPTLWHALCHNSLGLWAWLSPFLQTAKTQATQLISLDQNPGASASKLFSLEILSPMSQALKVESNRQRQGALNKAVCIRQWAKTLGRGGALLQSLCAFKVQRNLGVFLSLGSLVNLILHGKLNNYTLSFLLSFFVVKYI